MISQAQVAVIVPSVCSAERSSILQRAIQSIGNQTFQPVEVILCANGEQVDRATLDLLSKKFNIRVVRCQKASLQGAIVAGVEAANRDYFCFLDDDDELLPGSIEARVNSLKSDPSLDAVTINGYLQTADDARLLVRSEWFDSSDLLGSLMRKNWNVSCGTLFRRSSFNSDFFRYGYREHQPKDSHWVDERFEDRGFSWTFATAKLCKNYQVEFVDSPEFRIHRNPGTTSDNIGSILRSVAVWKAIQSLDFPRKYHSGILEKLRRSHHRLSMKYLERNEKSKAFKHHYASVVGGLRGLRYLSFSRYFFYPNAKNNLS